MKLNLREAFGHHAQDRDVEVAGDSRENIPHLNPGYVFQHQVDDLLRWWFSVRRVKSIFLIGDTGCGKTSIVNQICSRLNWPLFVIRMNATTRPDDLEGIMVPESKDGSISLKLVPGDAVRAYKEGGALLLDEGNRAHPSTHTWLNAMLEGYPIRLSQKNETITPHPNFRLLMAGNAGFMGDQTGLHPDCNPFCISFQDRLRVLRFDYPEESEEIQIFKNLINDDVPGEMVRKIVKTARNLRQLHQKPTDSGESLPIPFSVRTLEDLAYSIFYDYPDKPLMHSFRVTYSNGLEQDDRNVAERAIDISLGKLSKRTVNELVSSMGAGIKVKPDQYGKISLDQLDPGLKASQPNLTERSAQLDDVQREELLKGPSWDVLTSTGGGQKSLYSGFKGSVSDRFGNPISVIMFGPSKGPLNIYARTADSKESALEDTERRLEEKVMSGKYERVDNESIPQELSLISMAAAAKTESY